MSYCRWSECDVYAYDSCEGGVRFWVAGNDSLNRLCGTYGEAYQYAKELRDKHGLDVPSHAIDALREDAIDEAKQHLGPDSAVADMLSDIAKLRGDLEFERSENAKLRDELDAAKHDLSLFSERIVELGAENAKLRELCGRALAAIENNCGACAYFYDCDIMNDCKCVAPKKIRDELRELGVEISE